MSQSAPILGDSVTIQLVDSTTGHIVQVWEIPPRDVITLGRAPERDVTIPDPYVSRHHAELQFRGGEWYLLALGRNGVLINGREVTESVVSDGTAFRLGSNGPLLKFFSSPLSAQEFLTLSGSGDTHMLMPRIDTGKRDAEVQGIVESDYFQSLQQRASQMRQKRGPSEPESS